MLINEIIKVNFAKNEKNVIQELQILTSETRDAKKSRKYFSLAVSHFLASKIRIMQK